MLLKPFFVWIFDLDDTLYYCVEDYTIADEKIVALLKSNFPTLDPSKEKITGMMQAHSMAYAEQYGRSKTRFECAWVATYQDLCKEEGTRMRPDILRELLGYAAIPYLPETFERKGLMDGVEDTLDFLVEHGDRLCLLTRETSVPGKRLTQDDKINTLRLRQTRSDKKRRWFAEEDMVIVDRKQACVLRTLLRGHPPNMAFSVGDSADEMYAAKEIDMNVIYIPSQNRFERDPQDELVMQMPGVVTMLSVSEIRAAYQDLTLQTQKVLEL